MASNQTVTGEEIQKGYGFAYACWTWLGWPGEWEWVNAHFRARRFAHFAGMQS